MEESADGGQLPEGWVPLGEYRWFTAAAALSTIPSGFFTYWLALQVFELGVRLPQGVGIATRIFCGLVALAVAVAVIVLFQRWRAPRPFANFDTGEVRFGRRRTVPMSDIVWAQLIVPSTDKARSVSLVFGTEKKDLAAFRLIDQRGRVLDQSTVHLVAEVLKRTSIVMPTSEYDPSGRFAKYNFPTNVTREEAVDLVLRPPSFEEALPIPPVR